MNYKIEKNIPIIKQYRKGTWKELAEKMEIGDSVLVKDRTEANTLSIMIRRLGCRQVTRSDNNKIRVWKMENKNANE